MIRIENLHKHFGAKKAVDGISLDIPEGELFVMLGPNGAGKTTTIRILTGLLRPTDGRVLVAGHDVTSDGEAARAIMAYVPDEPYLYEKLTGREFLHFVGELYNMPSDRIAERTALLAERFGFASYIDELCGGYSHGMRQRVVIGSALLHEPRVLVVDEPMVGLDPRSARIVRLALKELAGQGVTIFMSTHVLSVAEDLADRIAIMNGGRIQALGTLEEIRAEVKDFHDLEDIFIHLTDDQP